MAKRSKKRAKARAEKKARKEAGLRPSGQSKYGKKNRQREIARGYSTRPNSPFYLPESQREEA